MTFSMFAVLCFCVQEGKKKYFHYDWWQESARLEVCAFAVTVTSSQQSAYCGGQAFAEWIKLGEVKKENHGQRKWLY